MLAQVLVSPVGQIGRVFSGLLACPKNVQAPVRGFYTAVQQLDLSMHATRAPNISSHLSHMQQLAGQGAPCTLHAWACSHVSDGASLRSSYSGEGGGALHGRRLQSARPCACTHTGEEPSHTRCLLLHVACFHLLMPIV